MPLDIQIQRSLTNTPATLLYGELSWTDNSASLYIGSSTGSPILLNRLSLQQAYNASINPEILTNATLGAFTIRRGSASDLDIVLETQSNTGTTGFTVLGNGTTSILKAPGTTNLIVAPTINDPQIAARPASLYVEGNTGTTSDGLRVYCNSGTAATSGYINFGYDGTAPTISLVDMDDDPPHIEFSTARLGLSNPGTYAAPAIVNRFGSRGPFAAALPGFSWWANTGVSGSTVTEIMSCDYNFLSLPTTTTVNRPITPVNNMVLYNSTLNKIDAYEGGAWTQFVDTTTDQTIQGNKIFSNKVQANTNIQQYFNSGSVSTTVVTFAAITGMSLTTSNTIVSKYKVSLMLNLRHSTTNATIVQIQIFVNGVADPDTLFEYQSQISTIAIPMSLEKIYTSVTSPTTFEVRWRRVSGTATVSVTNKSLIVQEIL